MCGISGYITVNPINGNNFLRSLHHRGPDSSGTYSALVNHYNVFIAHNRLSIIDLTDAGSQPMHSDDGKVSIVYNGEIYNHEQLRAKYLSKVKFRSKTDTEVILRLYELMGVKAVEYLNGDFAFSILDEKRKKMILARDRLGVKPLYYYSGNQRLIFASEMKTIMELLSDCRISEEALQNYFVFKYVPGCDTLIDGIKRLTPGSYIEIDLNDLFWRSSSYWNLKRNEQIASLPYIEAKNELYKLLFSAINMQLMSDVSLGTFFSGGLDSSIIAYFTRERKDITHYTAKKNSKDLRTEGSSSDFSYAAKLGNDWNLNVQPVDIGYETMELARDTLYYSDDLIADGSQIPSYLISAKAAPVSKVLLSGMGADELFFGYAGHQLTLFSEYLDVLPRGFVKLLTRYMSGIKVGSGWLKPYKRYLSKLGKYYHQGNIRYGIFNVVGDYENSLSIYNSNYNSPSDYLMKYFGDIDRPFDAVNKFEMENFLVKNLNYIDRMCMANSVEGRVPFLDYRLVEYAYSLPVPFKIGYMGETKKILKDTMKPYLPDYILKRRKAGFGMPLRSIFSMPGNLSKLIDYEFYAQYGGFSIVNIQKIIQAHLEGREDNSALIYALISFRQWYELFGKYIN